MTAKECVARCELCLAVWCCNNNDVHTLATNDLNVPFITKGSLYCSFSLDIKLMLKPCCLTFQCFICYRTKYLIWY